MHDYLAIHPEVAEALQARKAVVALESTIISHGMPYPRNVETARLMEKTIRDGGAVPATIAVLDGRIRIGLTDDDLEHLAMMERVLGPLPDDYRRKAETYMPNYFVSGQVNYPNANTNKKSRRYVQAMKRLESIVRGPSAYSKHNELFLSLLRGLLQYDVNKRLTAKEASRHPYFDLAPSELPL